MLTQLPYQTAVSGVVMLAVASQAAAQVTRDNLVDFLASEERQAEMVGTFEQAIAKHRAAIEPKRRARTNADVISSGRDGWSFPSRELRDKSIADDERRIAEYEAVLQHPIIRLPRLEPRGLQLQEVGTMPRATVLQVIDGANLLASADDATIWLRGFSTDGLVDNASIELGNYCLEVVDTKTYTTAIGATKTVFVLSPFDAGPAIEAAKQAIEDRHFRTWTDATGKFETVAKFVKFEASHVHLTTKDGKSLAVPMQRLSR